MPVEFQVCTCSVYSLSSSQNVPPIKQIFFELCLNNRIATSCHSSPSWAEHRLSHGLGIFHSATKYYIVIQIIFLLKESFRSEKIFTIIESTESIQEPVYSWIMLSEFCLLANNNNIYDIFRNILYMYLTYQFTLTWYSQMSSRSW